MFQGEGTVRYYANFESATEYSTASKQYERKQQLVVTH
jgi:hypothetical protein